MRKRGKDHEGKKKESLFIRGEDKPFYPHGKKEEK